MTTESILQPIIKFFITSLILLTSYSPQTAADPNSTAVTHSPQLANFKATYTLNKGRVLLGIMTRELRTNSDSTFTFESVSNTAGFLSLFTKDHIVERSLWHYNSTRMQPISYYYDRSGGKKSKHVQINFDWQGKKIVDIAAQTTWQVELPDGAQDSQLYQLALMQNLKRGEKKFEYLVAEDGKLKLYPFEVLAEETIATELGTFRTLKILNDRGKRKTTLWCAEQLDYLPVQMEQVENGHLLQLKLKKLEGLPRR